MLKDLVGKVDNISMNRLFSRRLETIKKNQIEILQMKKKIPEMKYLFNVFNSTLDTVNIRQVNRSNLKSNIKKIKGERT